MDAAIANRLNSLDKYKSLQQRRRRMSVIAPIDDKGTALDFEERIAICKEFSFLYSFNHIMFVHLVDSNFRNALFKLTAMLVHNINNSEEGDHELRFTPVNNMSNGFNLFKGNCLKNIVTTFSYCLTSF